MIMVLWWTGCQLVTGGDGEEDNSIDLGDDEDSQGQPDPGRPTGSERPNNNKSEQAIGHTLSVAEKCTLLRTRKHTHT